MIYGDTKIPPIKYSSGAAYLRGQGSGRVQRVEGLNSQGSTDKGVRDRYNDIITDIRIPKPGQEKSGSYEGEGFIIVRHPDQRIVEAALTDIVSKVRIVLG
jgi:hypothetical protein